MRIRLFAFVIASMVYGTAAFGQNQINPHTQINWPSATGCTTPGLVYSPATNTCVAGGGGTGNFTAGGDLSGSGTSQNVIGIQGNPVSSTAPTSPQQTLEWNGNTYVTRPHLINSGFSIYSFGDSICQYVGATTNAYAWESLFAAAVGTGSNTNGCVAGSLMADVSNAQYYSGGNNAIFEQNSTPSSARLNIIEAGTNDANQSNALNANVELAYQQYTAALMATAALPQTALIQAGNPAITTSGTVVPDYYYANFSGLNITSTGGSINFPITTYGKPLYIAFKAFQGGTGIITVTVDGTVQTDTITKVSAFPNAPAAGAPLNETSPFTSVPVLARYPLAAGAHTVNITCTTADANGCEMLWATSKDLNYDYLAPTAALYGVIPQQNDTLATNTATYNGLNQSVANMLASDGLNVYFIPVRNWIDKDAATLTAAMNGFDGAGPGGVTLNDAAATSGSAIITSASHTFTPGDIGKLLIVEGAGASGASLYGTIGSLVGLTVVPWTSHSVNLVQSLGSASQLTASATVSGATAYLGGLCQVYPGSTAAGLHPNNCGHALMARAALATLQPVTSPPVFNLMQTFKGGAQVNTPSGGVFTMNGTGYQSTATTGATTAPTLAWFGTPGSGSYFGVVEGFDGPNAISANFFLVPASTYYHEFCYGTPLNLATLSCPYKFGGGANGATFATWLSTMGEITPLTGQSAGNGFSFVNQHVTLINGGATTTYFLISPGSVTSSSVTTQGVGMTPGTYTVNASSGSAQLQVTVSSATAINGLVVLNPGSGYSTAPTFTVPTGSTQPVITGILTSPKDGERHTVIRATNSAFLTNVQGVINGAQATLPLMQNTPVDFVWTAASNTWILTSEYIANGKVALSSGVATVPIPLASTAGEYFLQNCGVSGTPGNLVLAAINGGTSFTINSLNGAAIQTADNSTVCWELR